MRDVVLQLRSWDMFSPFGDKSAFLNAMSAHLTLADLYPNEQPPVAFRNVPVFDTREQLGKSGTRSFDRHTGLFVKCASNAIQAADLMPEELRHAGIANGTAAGSLSSIQDFLLDTYRQHLPYFVNPAHMPNTVINCAAGQCAIWHGIAGPNATLSAGAQSFQSAARLAGRWARNDYARFMLLGAVEEITPITADIHRIYSSQFAYAGALAEGVAVFVVEAVERESVAADCATILETLTRTATNGDRSKAFRELVSDAIARAYLMPEQVELCVLKSWVGTSGHATELAAAEHLGVETLNAAQLFGNGYSASGAMQLALLLNGLRPGACGLTLSMSHNGSMACQVVRKGAAIQ